jgi:hypothetical protein
MEGKQKTEREDLFSRPVRAGKRTYFFDVKSTKGNEYYLTITESKRRIDENGKFHYDKHKVFLYKEDFENFIEGLNEAILFIRDAQGVELVRQDDNDESTDISKQSEDAPIRSGFSTDLSFDDLDD